MENASGSSLPRRKRNWLILAAGIATLAAAAITKLYLDRQFQSEIDLLVKSLDVKPGMVVGEIGAGKGRMSVAMAAKAGPGGHVFSTEIDPRRIEDIRRAVQKAGLHNVTVVSAGAEQTGLPDDCCDAIFMRGVYHHLTRPSDLANGLWKAMRPGGHLAVIDFPPSLLLRLWKPQNVPSNRGGHGIPQALLIDELTSVDFQVERIINDWPGGDYCVVFRKPAQILFTRNPDGVPELLPSHAHPFEESREPPCETCPSCPRSSPDRVRQASINSLAFNDFEAQNGGNCFARERVLGKESHSGFTGAARGTFHELGSQQSSCSNPWRWVGMAKSLPKAKGLVQ